MQKQLEQLLSPVYLVGGSVRDELLGKTPKDYDFATPYTPDEVEQAFRKAGRRPYNVGKRFGTVGIKLDGQLVEVTTFRTEEYTSGSRKPKVQFVSDLHQDLSRRDFTVNAMAKRGYHLTDPFKGQEDLKNKVLRAVGNPRARFKEDPLRMLRAARFAAQLGFSVEEDTEKKALELSYKMLEVSKERWSAEMDKLLTSDKPSVGLEFMMRTKLVHFMFPELSLQWNYDQNSPYHQMKLWDHTMIVVDNCPNMVEVRWAGLFHDLAKPFVRHDRPDRSNYVKHEYLGAEMVDRIGLHLRWSNQRRETVRQLVLTHLEESNPLRKADYIGKIKHE